MPKLLFGYSTMITGYETPGYRKTAKRREKRAHRRAGQRIIRTARTEMHRHHLDDTAAARLGERTDYLTRLEYYLDDAA